MLLIILFLTPFLTTSINSAIYTVYAHGIADKPSQVKRFSSAITTDHKHTICTEFSDTQKETGYGLNRLVSEFTAYNKKPINRSKMDMAGSEDIKTLHETILSIPKSDNIILFGCSRGAAALINTLGQNNPKNIAALVLDASPASMPKTIHPALASLGIHHSYDKTIFSILFPKYDKRTITPLESIAKIQNKNLPILLIHSQDDLKVPYSHALQLYKKFLNNGFKNVYIATIPQGRHAFLLQDPISKNDYLKAVHSFYKKNNLPYDKQYAQNDMEQYKLEISSVESQIIAAQKTLQKQYEQNKTKNLINISLITALLISYILYKKNL